MHLKELSFKVKDKYIDKIIVCVYEHGTMIRMIYPKTIA